MESVNGVIQRVYKVSNHKVIDMQMVESPVFQFSIKQTLVDIDEMEKCRVSGLPMPQEACAIMMTMTQPETFAIFNFLFEYMKDYQAAMSILLQNNKEDE